MLEVISFTIGFGGRFSVETDLVLFGDVVLVNVV